MIGTREGFFVRFMLASLIALREMHALGRSDLECSLKIYVELNETSLRSDKFCDSCVQKFYLSSCLVCISDCFGWPTKLTEVRRKLKHGAARTRARPSYRTSNSRRAIYKFIRSKFVITELVTIEQVVSSGVYWEILLNLKRFCINLAARTCLCNF